MIATGAYGGFVPKDASDSRVGIASLFSAILYFARNLRTTQCSLRTKGILATRAGHKSCLDGILPRMRFVNRIGKKGILPTDVRRVLSTVDDGSIQVQKQAKSGLTASDASRDTDRAAFHYTRCGRWRLRTLWL